MYSRIANTPPLSFIDLKKPSKCEKCEKVDPNQPVQQKSRQFKTQIIKMISVSKILF